MPENISVHNPAFDVTSRRMIKAFIAEKGIVAPPFDVNLKNCLDNKELTMPYEILTKETIVDYLKKTESMRKFFHPLMRLILRKWAMVI